MEEGAEGGEAGQAGPSDARLTLANGAMSERTDNEAIGSSPRWIGTVPYVLVTVVALWLSRAF